ncbi:MAG: hypothetical protein OEZ06_29275 [Myxococcales bacterium]|nr:hypothetical protein [Myxococcales bacterium]
MSEAETTAQSLTLPLPLDQLPAALKRFCNPKGPAPARVMAAKGLVPVRGHDQVTMLAQLAHDETPDVRKAALKTLEDLPENVIDPACEAPLPAAVLNFLAGFLKREEAHTRIAVNAASADATVERIAATASESLTERIATNEARLLRAPTIIEALYKNRNTRMSTADRLVDLAARNGIELTGIPAFAAHVEALQGELIPEPSDEPLPQDETFVTTLAADSEEDVFERDKVTGQEDIKKQFKPLSMAIKDMTKAEKIRLAMVGSKAARSILVRDNNKQIAYAAIASPQMTVQEAAEVAKSKEVSEDILRYVAGKREWIKQGEVKHNLVFNPKCPVGVSLKFISHLRVDELRQLSRSRNVSGQLRSIGAQILSRKEKR